MKIDSKTVATLATIPDGKTEHFYWDESMRRFGLRLRRSGKVVRRSWVVQYRHAGASRRMTIGKVEVLNPEQARDAARRVLAKVDLGGDPADDRQERRAKDRLTFKHLVAEYLEAKRGELRPETFRSSKSFLTGSYYKQLHSTPIDKITRRDVAQALVVISRENGKAAAVVARAKLSAFFGWTMRMGLLSDAAANPVVGTDPPKTSPPRHCVLNDQQIAEIWRACDSDDDFEKIIKLLVLLPARRREVGGLCWSEVDLERGVWVLPGTRAKNGRSISYPLVDMALDIIKSVPRRAGRDQLFGERHAQGFSAWNPHKKSLDHKTGLTDLWTIHDLRRTVATRLADLSTPPWVIEEILNHQSGHRAGVASIYNKSKYEREVRQALVMWESHIKNLVEGFEGRKVLPLRSIN
jgi:integrase